jgi:hypothetical protein
MAQMHRGIHIALVALVYTMRDIQYSTLTFITVYLTFYI